MRPSFRCFVVYLIPTSLSMVQARAQTRSAGASEGSAGLRAHEVPVTGGLATELDIAERAVAASPYGCIATRLVEHPRSHLEWRAMTNMLRVAARQLDNPIAELIAPKPHNRAHHGA